MILLVQREVLSECEAEGLSQNALRIRINLRSNRNLLLHNPSVTFGDSSLCTREPEVIRSSKIVL